MSKIVQIVRCATAGFALHGWFLTLAEPVSLDAGTGQHYPDAFLSLGGASLPFYISLGLFSFITLFLLFLLLWFLRWTHLISLHITVYPMVWVDPDARVTQQGLHTSQPWSSLYLLGWIPTVFLASSFLWSKKNPNHFTLVSVPSCSLLDSLFLLSLMTVLAR